MRDLGHSVIWDKLQEMLFVFVIAELDTTEFY